MGKITELQDLVCPELSYKIVGCAFDVYNELGSGHHENYYQKALAEALARNNIKFQEQLYCPINYAGKIVVKKLLDFLIEGQVVVEIKKSERFAKSNIDQVLNYLRINKLKLAILINFGGRDVLFKRIVNLL